jgi:hypothetical protein
MVLIAITTDPDLHKCVYFLSPGEQATTVPKGLAQHHRHNRDV